MPTPCAGTTLAFKQYRRRTTTAREEEKVCPARMWTDRDGRDVNDMRLSGIVFIAAAGHGVPRAGPVHPAAYFEVIAPRSIKISRSMAQPITGHIYRAPGVRIWEKLGLDRAGERDTVFGPGARAGPPSCSPDAERSRPMAPREQPQP